MKSSQQGSLTHTTFHFLGIHYVERDRIFYGDLEGKDGSNVYLWKVKVEGTAQNSGG